MFWNLFKRRDNSDDQKIVSAVVSQTQDLLNDLHHRLDLRFNEMSAQIREVELGLVQMETKLLTKDLRDKQAYGLLHYKLHESKAPKLTEEIEDLESKLRQKNSFKDQ